MDKKFKEWAEERLEHLDQKVAIKGREMNILVRNNPHDREKDQIEARIDQRWADRLSRLQRIRSEMLSGKKLSHDSYDELSCLADFIPFAMSEDDKVDFIEFELFFQQAAYPDTQYGGLLALVNRIIELEEQRFFPKSDDEIGLYLLKRIWMKQNMFVRAKVQQLVNAITGNSPLSDQQ